MAMDAAPVHHLGMPRKSGFDGTIARVERVAIPARFILHETDRAMPARIAESMRRRKSRAGRLPP